MKFKRLLGIGVAVALLIVWVWLDAIIHYRWSEQVIKQKQGEGWTLAAILNNSVDFTHPWNIFAKHPVERIWFVRPNTLTHLNENVVAVRILTVDYEGIEDVSVLAFDCTDKKAAFPAAGDYDPSKFQWRDYEAVSTVHFAKIVCR